MVIIHYHFIVCMRICNGIICFAPVFFSLRSLTLIFLLVFFCPRRTKAKYKSIYKTYIAAHKSSSPFRGASSIRIDTSVSLLLNAWIHLHLCLCVSVFTRCLTFVLLWISESLKILSFTTHSSAHILRSYYICQKLAKIAPRRKPTLKQKTQNRRFNRSFSSHLQCNRSAP